MNDDNNFTPEKPINVQVDEENADRIIALGYQKKFNVICNLQLLHNILYIFIECSKSGTNLNLALFLN